MFRTAALLGILGLFAATGVIVWSGWAQVALALAHVGWGILAIAALHAVPLVISSGGWRVLVAGKHSPSWGRFLYFMWLRAAVNNLMPVARIGGEIAVVRVMVAHGMRRNMAIALTVVELTLSVVATFAFVVLGIVLFALRVNDSNLVAQLFWGAALSLPAIAAMIAVQRVGFFRLLAKLFHLLFRDKWAPLAGDGAVLDHTVTALYRRHRRVVASVILLFLSWAFGSTEIAVALYLLGHPLPFIEAVMIEALILGAASAAFVVPGALGVQEAGFLIFGGMLGLPHDIAAALAVIRRCSDLICYVPGLIVWQMHEGRRLLRD
ncbi:MAG: flippase-like domain-containing protein [Alphaproteobacteria bacterium]|nr:flippase-like domain-containing protein [Alphaproteobacteria bacterium]